MTPWGKVGLLALLLLAPLGCGDDDEPDPEPAAPEPATPEPATPLACTLEGEPMRITEGSGPAAITAVGEAFVVASFTRTDEGGEDFWMMRVAPDTEPARLAEVRVEEDQPERHRNAKPALTTIDDQTVAVAVVGRGGEVSAGRLDLSTEPASLRLVPVESGARRTDPPAVVPAGEKLAVAWTQASTVRTPGGYYFCGFGAQFQEPTPSPPPGPTHGHQVRLAMVDPDGTVHTRRDATPRVEGAQAVAPAAIEGADPPAMVFLDPRAGIGTVRRVGVRAEGFVEPATVRPLSNLREQTDIAAAEGEGGPWLAYSAIGNGATTAIGLVSLADAAGPVPLVPGTGHDPLYVAGASTGEAAVFAAEAPEDGSRGNDTEIRVRAVNAAGPGAALVLAHAAESSEEPVGTVPAVRARPPEVEGSLDALVIRRIVRHHLSELSQCYARGVQRDPTLRGRVVVHFVVGPDGRVPEARIAESALSDEAVESCIAAGFRRWAFPRPESGNVTVSYPFELSRERSQLEASRPHGAFAPAIAARASDDLLAVTYATTDGLHLAWVRCR